MTQISCNCIICAGEFNEDELSSVALSKINTTNFKICQKCFDISDPENDYQQAKKIINSYLEFTYAKRFLKEAKEILSNISK